MDALYSDISITTLAFDFEGFLNRLPDIRVNYLCVWVRESEIAKQTLSKVADVTHMVGYLPCFQRNSSKLEDIWPSHMQAISLNFPFLS